MCNIWLYVTLTVSGAVFVLCDDDAFCNDTLTSQTQTPCRSCLANTHITCPEGTTQLTTGHGSEDCSYVQTIGTHRVRLKGCRHKCERVIKVASCCNGYWGSQCEECVGGVENQCYGRGLCDDGYEGTGMCTCLDAFNGTACEFCKDNQMYGENCDLECKCVNGTCNNGPEGDGSCECFFGYTGKLCDKEIPGCDNVTCADDAKCVMIGRNATCVCDDGYEEVETQGCVAIDACLSSPCDDNADCESTGPNLHRCTCKKGYQGDGLYCNPINRCHENSGGCVSNTSVCVYRGPGEVLEKMNANFSDPVTGDSLHIATQVLKTLFRDLLTEHGPLTIFVPTDKGFKAIRRSGLADFLKDKDRARQILFQHVIVGQLLMEDMANSTVFYTLQGSSAELQARGSGFRFKLHGTREKARILKSDVVASNGVIHIINSLLTSQPNQMGNKSVELFDLINSEGRHNRFVTLIRAAGMESWFNSANLTIFTPSNSAWSALPEGSLDYLQSPKGKDRLVSLLQNHIFPGVIRATDLINLQRLKSYDGSSVTVEISEVGKIMLNGVARISQTNIPGKNGVYHHIEAVLLPEGIKSVIPNRCDNSISRIIRGSCGPCEGVLKCPGSSDAAMNATAYGCNYWVKAGSRYIALIGCARMCNRTFVTPQCCPDFYGRECKPCHGAFKQICSGHGRCMDGYSFDGKCICDKGFDGVACQVCSDKKMFGTNCSQECTCLYGNCDNGPQGTGKCKEGSCADGYWGENCEMKKNVCLRHALVCHAHSVCVKDSTRTSCVCKPGYEGNGVSCQEIDPCLRADRGGCHPQATCKKTGPGMHQCTCDQGWVGDGTYYCYRSTPCVSSYTCHNNATCKAVAAGEYVCICDKGFQGNGTFCTSTDPCSTNNGGCHAEATCTSLGMGKANCTCPENYGGDGRNCYSSINVEIKQYPDLSQLAALFAAIPPEDNIVADLNNSYTLFAPNNEAIKRFKTKAPSNFWDDEGNILTLQGYHLLSGSYTISRLKQLTKLLNKVNTLADGMSANVSVINNKEVFVNDARVVKADIPAINGYIHVIDKVLEPYPVSVDQPSLEEFFMAHPEFSMFSDNLKKANLFTDVDDMDTYTLFVPMNAFLQHNGITTMSAKFLSLFIVPKLVMSTTISDGQRENTILGSHDQLQFSRRGAKIYVNDVLISRPDMPTDGGVIHGIDGIIRSTVRHCDVKKKNNTYGKCVSCQIGIAASTCPTGYTQAKNLSLRTGCTYTEPVVQGGESKFLGCQAWCTVNFTPGCCSGYYGPDCEECPGGADTPCNNHGVCSSSGECQCNERFSGVECQSCADGWTGNNCSIDTTSCDYNNGGCNAAADCSKIDGAIICVCKPGYIGTDGTDCRQPCAYANGGCHPNAKCIYQDKEVICECSEGYIGDGKHNCDKDVCKIEGSPCLPQKYCTYLKITGMLNNTVMCSCEDNYQGNQTGTFCINRSLFEAVKSMTITREFYKELVDKTWYSQRQDIISLLQGMDGNKTVFLPTDSSLQGYNLTTNDLENHIVNRSVMVEPEWWYDNGNMFETLAGKTIVIRRHSEFTVNGITILKRNLQTANGLVHIIAQPLWMNGPPAAPSTPEPTQTTGTSPDNPLVTVMVTREQKESSIVAPVVGAVFGVLALVAIAVLAVWLWKGKATGFMQFRKRFRKGSDNSLSLARIHSDKDEDLVALESPEVKKFNNPLYNVKDGYDNLDDD
ncbi:stabilin-2-like isoform X2 [Liolophura sinensis]|uniref:stabilin-2-like isoform X2 n=1 Tax=Liolophura sinensis TaxID=3198878 RepID=UPI0031585D0B